MQAGILRFFTLMQGKDAGRMPALPGNVPNWLDPFYTVRNNSQHSVVAHLLF